MEVKNLMEDVVAEVLDKQWNQLNVPCGCNVCRNDILALTLNQLPTRYVAHEKGQAIQRALFLDEQVRADVLRELAHSVTVVGANPSHG
ncbi:MAG: late competence development ComFB family protein [Tumebacillaceae bacterium]